MIVMPRLPALRSVWAGAWTLALLTACGGSGSDGEEPSGEVIPSSASVVAQCVAPRSSAVRDENDNPYPDRPGTALTEKQWVRAWIDETYLWYRDVRALWDRGVLNPYAYSDAVDYFYALQSQELTPSGRYKDQYHYAYGTATWLQLSSGATYGYGFDIALVSATPPRRAVVTYTLPNTAGAAAGVARGAEIVAVDGVSIDSITPDGVDTLNEGLYPTRAGTHTLRLRDFGSSSTRDVTLAASVQTLAPVQNVKTLPAPNQNVGYLQFNDHLASSEAELVAAFSQLAAAGVADLVLDLRYNGGGLLGIASQVAYMVAGPARTNGRTFERIVFNDRNPFGYTDAEKRLPFLGTTQGYSVPEGQPLPTLNLPRVYVLTTGGTCSASEAIVNGLRGVGVQVNLVGDSTCGKPYGFFPTDNCSVTYFAIQFAGVNDLGQGDYADGFTPTCSVADDFSRPLGDPAERVLATALALRNGGSCAVAGARPGVNALRPAGVGVALRRPPLRENRIVR